MIVYIFPFLLMLIGLSALLFRTNLIKKIIGLGILTNGIHLLLITVGSRGAISTAVAPILSGPEVTPTFLATAVDPLPQAIVLTSIVINVSILALGLAIAIHAYRHFGTLRTNEWENGKMEEKEIKPKGKTKGEKP